MLVKGIIKSIDYNSNDCTVRIPTFETASQQEEVTMNAIFSIVPGVYNNYKVDDIVWIDFENNISEQAVIVGKLYVDAKEEKGSFRGALSVENLEVSKNAVLPTSTRLSWDAKDEKVVGVDGDFSTYKTVGDILKRVKTTEDSLSDAKIQIINDGERLGARVSKVEEDNIRQDAELIVQSDEINARVTKESPDEYKGFGWSMDENGIVFESALGKTDESGEYVEDRTKVLKIDANGATVTGKLTVEDKEDNIIFEADPFGNDTKDPHVLIGGFEVDHNSLGTAGKEIGTDNSIAIISGENDEYTSIAGSEPKNNWSIAAGQNFGVDNDGRLFSSDANVSGTLSSDFGTIGGFSIDENRLYAGNPGEDGGLLLFSQSLVGYISKSDVHITDLDTEKYIVSKIKILKNVSQLTVYIASTHPSKDRQNTDYLMLSYPGVSYFPKRDNWDWKDGVYASTRDNYISSLDTKNLNYYTKVTYKNLQQGYDIWVVMRRTRAYDGNYGTGYLLIQNNDDCVEVQDYSYDEVIGSFERNTARDFASSKISIGASITLDSVTGITASKGTIGKLVINSDGALTFSNSSTKFIVGRESTDLRMPKFAIYAQDQRIDDCVLGFGSNSQDEHHWCEFNKDGFYTYRSSVMDEATVTGKISYLDLKHICFLDTVLGTEYEDDKATCPHIIVFRCNLKSGEYWTFGGDDAAKTWGFNEIIGASITEQDSSGTTSNNPYFTITNKNMISVYNTTSYSRTYSVIIIAK